MIGTFFFASNSPFLPLYRHGLKTSAFAKKKSRYNRLDIFSEEKNGSVFFREGTGCSGFVFKAPLMLTTKRQQKYKRSLFYGLKCGNSHHVLCIVAGQFSNSLFCGFDSGISGVRPSLERTKTHLFALPLLTLPIARPTHLFQRVHGIHTNGGKNS